MKKTLHGKRHVRAINKCKQDKYWKEFHQSLQRLPRKLVNIRKLFQSKISELMEVANEAAKAIKKENQTKNQLGR